MRKTKKSCQSLIPFWGLAIALLWGDQAVPRRCFVQLDDFTKKQLTPPTAALESLFKLAVLPVLEEGNRTEHVRISFTKDKLHIKSKAGDYTVEFTTHLADIYPLHGLPEVELEKGRLKSRIALHPNFLVMDAERVAGALRSAFRADPYLNSHLRVPGTHGKLVLSYPQREALAALVALEDKVDGVKGLTRGLVMPVGMGKTVVAAKYVDGVSRYQQQLKNDKWAKKPKVLFVVENGLILDRAVETFTAELDFKKVAKVYDEDAGAPLDPDSDMVAITRTSYFARIEEINKLMVARGDQPWVVIFDEAQHLGKEEGQFDAILKDMHRRIDARHRILLLSATLWHPDKALITDYLEGNIYGAFLTPEEQTLLKQGVHLAELCRLQFFRAVQLGYLSPIHGLNLIRSVGGVRTEDLLGTDEFTETKDGKLRVLTRYRALLEDVGKRIKANRTPGVADRGVIYVDSIERANAYAQTLSEIMGEEVRAFHSGPGLRSDTYEWFNDHGNHATPAERRKPKYLVCVDILKEGIDVPAINVIVLVRKYGKDLAGFRNLIQNIGRGSRHFAWEKFYKLHLTLLDYSLYSRWLRDGLAQISIEPSDGRTNRDARPGFMVVDDEILDPITFRNSYFALFPRDGSFLYEFPFFDLEQFQAEGLRFLHEVSGSYGIRNYTADYGTKNTILRIASFLANSPEKAQLMAELESDAQWGWTGNDGIDSKGAQTVNAPSYQRIYRALYRIAALLKLESRGGPLNLFRLYRGDELRRMVAILDPQRAHSLQTQAERAIYGDKAKGAWTVLAAESMSRNLGKVSDADGLTKLMEALAADLKPPADRERYLRRLHGDLAPEPNDGQSMNATAYLNEQTGIGDEQVRVRGAMQRSYRAFYALALEARKMPGGETIHLDRLYEKAEAEKVLRVLSPQRAVVIFESALKRALLDEDSGAAPFLAARSAQLGFPSFARDFAPMRILVRLAGGLVKGKDRTDLETDLQDVDKWGWTKKDGAHILTEGYDNPTRQFYLALFRLAETYNRLNPVRPVDLKKLHLRDEAEKLYDYLILGTWAPAPNEKVKSFAKDAVPTFEEKARDYRITAYSNNFGPQRLAVAALARLKKKHPTVVTEAHERAVGDETLGGWKKLDGEMLRAHTSPRTDYRTYKAFSLLAVLCEQATGKAYAVEKPAELAELLDYLAKE